MADATMLALIRPGMHVRSSDRKTVGKVRQVHQRDAETYVEVTPHGSPSKPWQLLAAVKRLFVPERLFVPGTSVVDVAGKHVHVAMDAKTAKGCTWRPTWIAPEVDDPEFTIVGRGGGGS